MKKYLTLFAILLAIGFGFSLQAFADTNPITISSVSALLSSPGYINATGKENILVSGTAPAGSTITVVLSDSATLKNSLTSTQIIPAGLTSYVIGFNGSSAYPEALHDGLINISAYITSSDNISVGLPATATIIKNTVAPTIVILGDNPFKCKVRSTCPDLGAIAIDSFGNKLTNISVVNNVKTNIEGNYTIKYSTVDLAGNEAAATRKVTVSTSNTISSTTVVVPDIVQTLMTNPVNAPIVIATTSPSETQPVPAVVVPTPVQEVTTPSIPVTVIQVSGITGTIKRSLIFGTKGSDVKLLQILLAKDSTIYPEGLISSYFGNLTKLAVQRFQNKYKIASKGLPGYGQVGPKTKAKLIELYGN